MTNRRHFLKTTTGAIVVSVLPDAFATTKKTRHQKVLPVQKSIQQQYVDKIDNTFLVRADNASYLMMLKEVESGPKNKGTEQFRLVFTSKNDNLPNAIYSVTHLTSLKTQKINIEKSLSVKNQYFALFNLLV